MRLDRTFGLAVGEGVTVELLTGERLPVAVARALGSHADVEFVGPIAPGHPAMVALDEAALRYKRLHSVANDT